MRTPVVIVGLGRIGAGNAGLAGDLPLSHLAAVRQIPELMVSALVDSDPKACAAVQAGGIPPEVGCIAADLSEVPARVGEVIAICTPPADHAATLQKALARRPSVIVIEKPLAQTLIEGRRMVETAAGSGSVIRVNFNRRFDPRLQRWRAKAPAHPQAIVVRYGKGLMNYGSHLIDLLLDWYGPVESVQALGGPAAAHSADPAQSFRCRMSAGFDVTAIGLDNIDYDQFELDILARDQRVELRAGGADIRRYAPVDGLFYKGYRHLAEIEDERDTGAVGGFAELYQAIARHLGEGAPLPGCDDRAALAGIAVLEAVRRSAAAGGTIVPPEVQLAQAA